ncbi:MAG: phosphoribosylformylglycinamidine synthase, partial [Planctomycetes bacterium]|nr:phosphoribosylformylglycinamidine synthase [Planctomycetota bacterium]
WISEAQERMVLAVPPENWDEFHALCAAEGVEATVIGRFTDTGRLVLTYRGHEVGNLSMHFLHEGRPPVVRDAVWRPPSPRAPRSPRVATRGLGDVLHQILGSLNVASKEWIIRQYDHEVQGGSVVKPLVGVHSDGPSDAAVVRPDLSSSRGIVIACGMNPRYGDFDPYWMAASAIDEAVRNAVCVGADSRRIAILDNFCWGNTERPETLGSLVRAALGCRDTAVAYRTPFISGKDSLNNEFSYETPEGERRTVAIPPSLLISALGQIEDVSRCVTMDLKKPGNLLFLVGETRDELGGSHFQIVTGGGGGEVPQVDFEVAPRVFALVHALLHEGAVRSCHDLSEGGLAVAAAEMSFAGGFGVDIDLRPLSHSTGLDDAVLLYSESNTRFLLEVPPPHAAALRTAAAAPRVSVQQIGSVATHDRVRVVGCDGQPVIDVPWRELKESWQHPLRWS